MRDFSQVKSKIILDSYRIIIEWERIIFPGKNIKDITKQERINKFQQLKAQVQELWLMFNQLEEKDKHYMEKMLQGYLASFFIPNIERTFSITTRPEIVELLLPLFEKSYPMARILDFGAGPLSASIGFLVAAQAKLNIQADLDFNLEIVERSDKAIKMGQNILNNALIRKDSVTINQYSSLDKVAPNYDVALAANIFNEIPVKHRFVTAKQIIEKLRPGGMFFLIEPGQDKHSWALGTLRDELIKHFATTDTELRIVSPCLHHFDCPLAKSERNDWCAFQSEWSIPALQQEINHYTSIEHKKLNYSYVTFIKGTKLKNNSFARIVSDPILISVQDAQGLERLLAWAHANKVWGSTENLRKELTIGNKVFKVLCCTNMGQLESVFYVGSTPMPKRGEEIEIPVDSILRCVEQK